MTSWHLFIFGMFFRCSLNTLSMFYKQLHTFLGDRLTYFVFTWSVLSGCLFFIPNFVSSVLGKNEVACFQDLEI